MAKKRPKKAAGMSGGARLMAKGRVPVQLGLEPDEVELIDSVRGDTPRTKFITRAAIAEARRVLAGERTPRDEADQDGR